MRGAPGTRRAFVIVAVMVLLVIVSVVTAWMLRAATIRKRVVQQQIMSYTGHHDLLSVRHIAQRWMSRQPRQEELEELVGSALARPHDSEGVMVYDAVLPDGLAIRMFLNRAQGVPPTDLEGATSGAQRELMQRVLESLYTLVEDRGAMTRPVGPIRMVLTSAPDEVLLAIDAAVPGSYPGLVSARERELTTPSEVQTALEENGLDAEDATTVVNELLTETTRLWRITAFTTRNGNRRDFELYMVNSDDMVVRWSILQAKLVDTDARAGTGRGRSR